MGPHVSIGFEGLGGAVNSVRSDATAYPHRHAIAEVIVQGLFPNASDKVVAQKNSNAIYQDLKRYLQGVYVNNMDDSLNDWGEQYYGQNLAKLREIKAAV